MAETKTHEMDGTWLVQRLEKPRASTVFGKGNPFAFGGGLRNGGLSEEAMGLLRDIFSFDYMGAAEFEFGAVPKALQVIAKQAGEGVLLGWHFDVLLSQVKPDFRDKSKPARGAKGRVYALARADWTEEVESRVKEMAAKGYGYGAKEYIGIDSALRPDPRPDAYRRETCGWLELDNGFLFFTDEAMWRATCDLFGVQA